MAIVRPKTAAGHPSMEASTRVLLEALGWPPVGLPLPVAAPPVWRDARGSLQVALRSAGLPFRARPPRALWIMLHGSPPPLGATWGGLLAGQRPGTFAPALGNGGAGLGLQIASWNLRWMVSPHAAQNPAKRDMVR